MGDTNLQSVYSLLKEIEKLRKLLHEYEDLIDKGKIDGEVLSASQELDKLIVEYQLKLRKNSV